MRSGRSRKLLPKCFELQMITVSNSTLRTSRSNSCAEKSYQVSIRPSTSSPVRATAASSWSALASSTSSAPWMCSWRSPSRQKGRRSKLRASLRRVALLASSCATLSIWTACSRRRGRDGGCHPGRADARGGQTDAAEVFYRKYRAVILHDCEK